MKFFQHKPFLVLGLVLLWRVLLLVLTVQPIPANDAFAYDGAVVNFLHEGRYCNPSLALVFPISGREVYAMYPPLYQMAMLVWMKVLGTSVIAAMTLHLALFAISGWLTLIIIKQFFPAAIGNATAMWLLFGFTFDDRPESLAYVFGLGALWLVARQISGNGLRWGAAIALTVALWLCLYSSVIVGAYFFGVGFLACAVAACHPAGSPPPIPASSSPVLGFPEPERGPSGRFPAGSFGWRRIRCWFAPFIGAAALFVGLTFAIAKLEPRWWAGFLESARQQSVMSTGWHAPHPADLLKLIRTAPVFLLGLAMLPLVIARRKTLPITAWLALVAGMFAMGWVLLVASVTLLAANYVTYTLFTQVILGAGLLALGQQHFPQWSRRLQAALLACVLLVSVRAIGMSTWGAACVWKNSYPSTQAVLRAELEPFVISDQPVLLSPAYLYCAANLGVKNPIDCGWYFDHVNWTNHAEVAGLIRCRPPKLLLTQFDYYRTFEALLAQLRQQPDCVDIRVRNLAAVTPPDAIPALRRVVQHISWAPVIVDLHWKQPPSP